MEKNKINKGIVTILVLIGLISVSGICSAYVSVSSLTTGDYYSGEVAQFSFNIEVMDEGCCLLNYTNFTITNNGNSLACSLPLEFGSYPDHNCDGLNINVTVTETNHSLCRQYGGNDIYTYTINWAIPCNWGVEYTVKVDTYACGNPTTNEITFNTLNCDNDNDTYNSSIGCCNGTDCDDNNASINPGVSDKCFDGIDNDCDGIKDEGCEAPSRRGGPGAPPVVIPSSVCGDGKCEVLEDCTTCPQDCGECPKPVVCGDGTCEGDETYENCPADCEKLIVCGDGTCEGDETYENCPKDCPKPIVCGDGTCEGDETCKTCEADCGACPKPKLMINCPEDVESGGITTCRVIDETGDAVPLATVVTINMPDGTTETFITDEEGNIQFSAPKSGEIDASASKEDYDESEKTRISVISVEKECWLFGIKFIVCWYWWLLILLLILLLIFLRRKKEEEE